MLEGVIEGEKKPSRLLVISIGFLLGVVLGLGLYLAFFDFSAAQAVPPPRVL